ncbi:MAG: ATP-binding cassette domain-containing protein [Dysgonamonadaceae bacterium]|jgi:ABC-2 type transport system ATP-binding protein|nr:ATP-binding cassette domain-containing protein [Dysgonamonadaceae bacterium]
MISIKNLTVSYKKNVTVIDSLDLTVNNHTICGIAGLNGAGKTTLFNAVFGLIKKDKGEVFLDGQTLTKKDIAFLPTENFFYPLITGREYLKLFNSSGIDKWNSLFKLPLDTLIDDYSTGMKKKLALLGVFIQNKSVIMLDEPCNGLDVESSHILKLILLRLKEAGKTLIISSHIMELLTNVCDCIHYLESGKVKLSRNREQFNELAEYMFAIIEKGNTKTINELINY